MQKRLHNEAWVVGGLFLLALALRLIFLLVFDNVFSHEGESYSKINLVQTWINHGKPYPDSNFGPLHTWLIYLLVSLFGDWIWPVRIFGWLAGSLTVPLFYYLVREEFDPKVAAFSALLLATFPVHLRASPTGLAEVPYLLFFVFGLYGFYRAMNRPRGNWPWLVLGAVGVTAAGMIRFEAWLFLPVLCLLMLRKSFWRATAFGALCAIFPLVHMYITWRTTGDPTNFAKTSALSFLQYMPNLPMSEKATGWFVSLWKGMGPPGAVLAAMGIVYALARRRWWTFAALLLVPLGFMQYKAMTDTIDPSLERYIVSFAMLGYPYAALLLVRFGQTLQRKGPALAHLATILLVAVAGVQVAFAATQAVANSYPDDIRATVKWLRDNVGPDDIVLPDQRFHPYVQLESRLNYDAFVSLQWAPDRKSLDREAFDRLLAETPPTIIVLDYLLADDPDNMVNSNLDVFHLPKGAERAEQFGLLFEKAFAQGDFVVYRTRRAEDAS